MALPTTTDLKTLNTAYLGQPFCNVPAKSAVALTTLDVAYLAQPFNSPAADVTWQYAHPSSDIATNSWTPSTGVTLYGVMDETVADDGDYIFSPPNPTTEQFEVKLSALTDPLSSDYHTIVLHLEAKNADTAFDLKLVQNTTVLDSWTETVTADIGAVERSKTFSGAVADSISDYTDLRVRGVARAP